MQRFTLKKQERLKSQKLIEELFSSGHSFIQFPVRVVWKEVETDLPYPAQVAFSVSKRKFKKASDRNRIKRLMKEAWRLNKHGLYNCLEKSNRKIAVMLIFIGNELIQYSEMESKIIVTLQRLCRENEGTDQ